MSEIKSNNDRNIVKKVMSKLFVGILLASVLIGMLAVIPEEVRAETWSIETVDSAGDVGWFTSIAVDSNGYPHISYQDRANMDLKYAKWTGSKWSITTVDSTNSVGEYTSIALDSKGYAHISYLYRTNLDLKYAKWTGSKWSIETVDSTDHVGFETSIALDNNDNPHISYRDASNLDLKYAKWTGSKWGIETVDSAGDVGGDTSIALDSNGYPHISYLDYANADLKYAKWIGSKWSIETVDSTDRVGYETSIALDSDDNPHISYLDYTNEGLKYAKWTGSKWSITTVDSTDRIGYETSIALDSKGYPHISLIKKDLKYAKWTGNKWSIETVDSTDCVGYGTSAIALDSNDNPHISYWDASNKDLKYAELMLLKVPTPPRNLQATAGDGYLDLRWSAPNEDGGSPITGYKIYRGTAPGGEIFLMPVVNVLSYTDDDVINDQRYYYQVSAENTAGEGERSNAVGVEPKEAPPTECPEGCDCLTEKEAKELGYEYCEDEKTLCGYDQHQNLMYCYQKPKEQDSDNDGFSDEQDNCPNNYNPQQEDSDNDGIGDECDTRDDRDSDGDGIKNCDDQCPNDAETFNGYMDDDGCPDEKPEEGPSMNIKKIPENPVLGDRVRYEVSASDESGIAFIKIFMNGGKKRTCFAALCDYRTRPIEEEPEFGALAVGRYAW